jgi:2,5-diketo-D-gluconate reductase B
MTGSDAAEATVDVAGASIPKLGLGTWQNTGEQCATTVENALEMGYRHVDTAQAYDNEIQVGRGIERASVDREDVFLTTKVWRSNLRDGDVQESVRESLDKLQVDSVDLLLAHWPHPRVDVEETLRAMAELSDDGVVEHVGVANYTADQLAAAADVARENGFSLVTDQVLYNPLKDQSALKSYAASNDVSITAYSPLARGGVVGDKVLGAIGEKYDKSAPQVAIRWLVQQEDVIAIPKATGREHLRANLDVFDFALTDDEMNRIHQREPGLKRRLFNRLPGLMRRFPL